MSSLSPYQSASLGQGVQGFGNAISTIFDPRIQMQAQQARLANEANALEAKYKPQIFQSQIAQNNASAAAAAASAEKYRAETEAARQRAAFGQNAANLQAPQGVFPGVPYAPDVVAPPSPQQMQSFQDQRALLSNLYGGGGANDLTQGMARNAALNAQDELAARRAAVALSGNLPNINQAFMPELQGQVISAQGANDVAVQNAKSQGDLQVAMATGKLKNQGDMSTKAFDALYGNPVIGERSGPTNYYGGKGMSLEALSKHIKDKFAIPGQEISPEMMPAANAYRNTMGNLTGQGLTESQAASIASQWHGDPVYSSSLFGSPGIEAGKDFNMTPMSPSEAATVANDFFKKQNVPAANVDPVVISQIMRIMASGGMPSGDGFVTDGAPAPVPAPTPPNPVTTPTTPAPATFTPTQTLGQQATAKRKGVQQAKDTEYNKETINRLDQISKAKGIPLSQIIATAMAGGQENQTALEAALYQMNPPALGGIGMGQSGITGPSIKDIQNAARDPEIQKMFGAEGSRLKDIVNHYMQTGNAGQTQVGRFIVTPQ